MLEHLSEIKDVKFQPAKAWLKYRLAQCRSDTVEKAKSRQPASHALAKLGSWWGIHEEIADVQPDIDDLLAKAVHLQLDAFMERAADPQGDPHALRIAGKSLRYTLEMAKAHGRRLPHSFLRPFKQMQEALGLWHDYVVLTERILSETVGCDLALHDPQLQAQILKLSQRILDKAQHHLKKMTDLWKQTGPALSPQIRKSFPLTAPKSPQKIEEPPTATPEPEKKEEEPYPAPPAKPGSKKGTSLITKGDITHYDRAHSQRPTHN
jgi:CHAD domain-containing protein